MRSFLIQRYFLILFMIIVAVGFVVAALYFLRVSSQALSGTIIIPKSNLTSESVTQEKQGSLVFSLSSDQQNNKLLYESKQAAGAGVVELMDRSIEVEGQLVLPSQALRNFRTMRVVDDAQDPYLKSIGKQSNRKHFIFEQTIDGKPIYGARLSVHMQNDKEIYGMYGAIVQQLDAKPATLTREQAQARALSYAQAAYKNSQLSVKSAEEVIFNPQLLYGSSDSTNYVTLMAIVAEKSNDSQIGSKITPSSINRRIFISMIDGKILHDENLFQNLLRREIYDGSKCDQAGCSQGRDETSGLYGDTQVDNAFQYAGDTYAYYLSVQQRDSYDNLGSFMRALVKLPSTNGFLSCPNNAVWTGAASSPPSFVITCDGMTAKDVIGHEFTHGVVETTAGLIYQNQSGALNESYADIFATAVDQNWTIGEDTSLGVIRNFDDPTRNRPSPGPDRLFSPNYYCGSGDAGGVHENSSVINHAFYLMVQGGTFNGCTMRGIGRDKAYAIMYQTLTRYLNQTSNFRSVYSGVLQACTDLYGGSSDDCAQVKKSLQSVEIDQQPLSDPQGARCIGIPAQIPQCVTAAPPTITVTPTRTPTPTLRVTVTPTPTMQTITPTIPVSHNNACLVGDTNGDGYVDLRDFEYWRRSPH